MAGEASLDGIVQLVPRSNPLIPRPPRQVNFGADKVPVVFFKPARLMGPQAVRDGNDASKGSVRANASAPPVIEMVPRTCVKLCKCKKRKAQCGGKVWEKKTEEKRMELCGVEKKEVSHTVCCLLYIKCHK